MIIGTAGHIDHGKTALVKALTGVDTDRLKEEKARGISIDLGYAYAPLETGAVLGFVDVPGHERFIHNMLAGATGIDYALLVVAVDDGIMPQTREHLHILRLLGLSRGAVALTKIDRVDDARTEEVAREVSALLADTPLAGAPIFGVSSLTGQGIGQLRAHLAAAAQASPARALGGRFRLAIDRSFSLAGSGTVVTGTVFSGEARPGDRLLLSPSGLPARVRSIHADSRPAECARAGQRCALALVGVEKKAVRRGDWALEEAIHKPTARFDARIELLAGEPPLPHWSPVHVHLAAGHVTGRVALLEGERLAPGPDGSGFAQFVLDQPLGALAGDRFVIRDPSAQRTLGGGVVLDPFPPARRRRSPARLGALRALELPDRIAALRALCEAAPDGIALGSLAIAWNLGDAEAEGLWQEADMILVRGAGGPLGFARVHWQARARALLDAAAVLHREAPGEPGFAPRTLHARVEPGLRQRTFELLLQRLIEDRALARAGALLRLAGHCVGPPAAQAQLWQRIEPLLRAALLQPPGIADLARTLRVPEARVRAALTYAAANRQVYALERDTYLLREAVLHYAGIVRDLAAADPAGSVRLADFRDRISRGRRYAVKLLEFFDRIGFTLRFAEAHRLRRASALFEELEEGSGRDSSPGGAAGLQIR